MPSRRLGVAQPHLNRGRTGLQLGPGSLRDNVDTVRPAVWPRAPYHSRLRSASFRRSSERNEATLLSKPDDHQRSHTRVLFVNTREEFGADVAVHMLLARHLSTIGVDVAFTVNRHANDAATMLHELRGANVEVICPPLGRPAASGAARSRGLVVRQNAAALRGIWQVAQFIRARQVDILHATDRPRDALLCTLLGHLTGRPSVIHIHSNYYPGMSKLSRWAFAHCTCVLGVSEFTRASMEAAGVPPERLAAVLNAIDVARFDPDRAPRGLARQRWGIPPGAPLLGLVGRLIPYKGHTDLLQALAARAGLAQAHVLVVGDDTGAAQPYVASLQEQAAALGLAERVHFTGAQDVVSIYADLDILAVPSWDEPFGLVVTEGLAMRVPVVAYRAGGIPEIVRSGVEGVLVTRRAINDLADALLTLVEQPELRARLGAAGRQRVLSYFTPDRQADEVLALYRRLIRRKEVTRDVAVASR